MLSQERGAVARSRLNMEQCLDGLVQPHILEGPYQRSFLWDPSSSADWYEREWARGWDLSEVDTSTNGSGSRKAFVLDIEVNNSLKALWQAVVCANSPYDMCCSFVCSAITWLAQGAFRSCMHGRKEASRTLGDGNM